MKQMAKRKKGFESVVKLEGADPHFFKVYLDGMFESVVKLEGADPVYEVVRRDGSFESVVKLEGADPPE